jgi:hypothetical protein
MMGWEVNEWDQKFVIAGGVANASVNIMNNVDKIVHNGFGGAQIIDPATGKPTDYGIKDGFRSGAEIVRDVGVVGVGVGTLTGEVNKAFFVMSAAGSLSLAGADIIDVHQNFSNNPNIKMGLSDVANILDITGRVFNDIVKLANVDAFVDGMNFQMKYKDLFEEMDDLKKQGYSDEEVSAALVEKYGAEYMQQFQRDSEAYEDYLVLDAVGQLFSLGVNMVKVVDITQQVVRSWVPGQATDLDTGIATGEKSEKGFFDAGVWAENEKGETEYKLDHTGFEYGLRSLFSDKTANPTFSNIFDNKHNLVGIQFQTGDSVRQKHMSGSAAFGREMLKINRDFTQEQVNNRR